MGIGSEQIIHFGTENRLGGWGQEWKGKMADGPPLAATRGSNTHFSDLLRALRAPRPHRPSALVIWPILLKVELIERIDLRWGWQTQPQ